MYEVLLVNGRRIWVDIAGARDLQQEGKLLYVIKEKESKIIGKKVPVPNIFTDLSIN